MIQKMAGSQGQPCGYHDSHYIMPLVGDTHFRTMRVGELRAHGTSNEGARSHDAGENHREHDDSQNELDGTHDARRLGLAGFWFQCGLALRLMQAYRRDAPALRQRQPDQRRQDFAEGNLKLARWSDKASGAERTGLQIAAWKVTKLSAIGRRKLKNARDGAGADAGLASA